MGKDSYKNLMNASVAKVEQNLNSNLANFVLESNKIMKNRNKMPIHIDLTKEDDDEDDDIEILDKYTQETDEDDDIILLSQNKDSSLDLHLSIDSIDETDETTKIPE
eukprot:317946_1